MAFVSSFTPTALLAKSAFSPCVSAIRPGSTAKPVRMALNTKEEKATFDMLESNRVAKEASEFRGPQGFTPYAERVNGRIAMMGFFIGLVTEVVSGKPINEQMFIMFSPLVNFVNGFLH